MTMPNDRRPSRDGAVSKNVAQFYDTYGWVDQGGGARGEDSLFRQFPQGHEHYALGAARRIENLATGRRGAMLLVGCGDMPDDHLRLARAYAQVTCIDISATALTIARGKLGAAAAYRCESIAACALPDGLFDFAFCAHVIYHIDRNEQEAAVRQMLRLVRPGGRVVIIDANPRSVFTIPGEAARWLQRRLGGRHASPRLYYHPLPRGWWRRFTDTAHLRFVPWEVIGSRPARALLRGDGVARLFFRTAAWFETTAPDTAARLWQYRIVVLDRKSAGEADDSR